MSKSNWANRTKAATAAVPVTRTSGDRGTRYEGALKAATLKSYKTGSFGVEFQYALNDRTVYENVVLSKLSEEGVLTPTKYGANNLKRRLQAFGLSADEINAIGIPRTVKDEFNLSGLIGAEVAVYCITTEYMGKPRLEVKSVFPLDNQTAA